MLVTIRDIIKKVERSENLRKQAFLVSGLVEWKHQQIDGTMASFDIYTNLQLEEALETKQSVKIEINNQLYIADVMLKKAVSARGRKVVELQRKDLKGEFVQVVCGTPTKMTCFYVVSQDLKEYLSD